MPDDAGASTCTDDCLEAWPAIPGPATAGDGVDASLLATAARPDDGSEQATCDGWPLYTFAQDTAPGDVTGQGSGDVWYVLDATCTPVGMGEAAHRHDGQPADSRWCDGRLAERRSDRCSSMVRA